MAENCSVNKRIAILLNKPHVGCLSHKLNIEIDEMIDFDVLLSSTLNQVHETMTQCRMKLKKSAILQNLTDLSPIVPNQTRWSSKLEMIKLSTDKRREYIRWRP